MLTSDMQNDTRFRAAYLAAQVARFYPDAAPHMIALAVWEMQKAARAAKAWAEKKCNIPMTERQEEAGEARIDRLESAVNALLADLDITPRDGNATVTLGGDPRGPCARLHIPGERGDGFGDGFAIY